MDYRRDELRSVLDLWAKLKQPEQRALVKRYGADNSVASLDGIGSLRASQLPPGGDWGIWAILAGRGFGKTRAGAEWVHALAAEAPRRFALVGTSLENARSVMVEGESGLLARVPEGGDVTFIPSLRQLHWPTGYLYRAGDMVTRYPADTVGDRAGLLHIRGFHPLDDHYGVGCLGAAAGAVSVHNAAATWNRALLDNAARPSGALRAVETVAERDYLDWCGMVLGRATLALRDAVAADETLLLFYAPQVLGAAAPELIRANLPAAWTWPAFDVLQLEDYEFVTRGDAGGQARARAAITERLGYPLARQHYFAGFAAVAADWLPLVAAAASALERGVAETFVWAWPQVARDGFAAFDIQADGENDVAAFHDVLFPLQLGYGAAGGPEFSTQVVVTGSGHEQRNSQWADARLYYDAGVGVRSEADLTELIAFFRARRGQAHGFRFSDPLDRVSGPDQVLGVGDAGRTRFALVKHYGGADDRQTRRITRPVAGSVVVAVGGVPRASGWVLAAGGHVDFDLPPANGAVVTAEFAFDVPVRFAADRIDVSMSGWRAGELPSVPLVEVRED